MADPAQDAVLDSNEWEKLTVAPAPAPAPASPPPTNIFGMEVAPGTEGLTPSTIPSSTSNLPPWALATGRAATETVGGWFKGIPILAPQLKPSAVPSMDPDEWEHLTVAGPKASESDAYRIGQAIQKKGEEIFPVTEEMRKEHPWQTGIGTAIGGTLPYAPLLIAAPESLLGTTFRVGLGAAGMGLSGAADTYDDAISKGATEDQAKKAAGMSAAVNVAIGSLRLDSVLAPIRQTIPGLRGWATAKLAQAGQNGLTFASTGAAQQYLQTEIEKAYYNPNAKWEPGLKELAEQALAGGFLGAFGSVRPRVGERAPVPLAKEGEIIPPDRGGAQPGAARLAAPGQTIEGKVIRPGVAGEAQRLLPVPEATGEARRALPAPEAGEVPPAAETAPAGPITPPVAIPPKAAEMASRLHPDLGATPREAAEVLSLVDNEATPQEIEAHPLIQRAYQMSNSLPRTNEMEGYGTPEWKATRIGQDANGNQLVGYDGIQDYLTEQAKNFSTAGPVRQERRATIVIGPGGAGKSTLMEPLARNRYAAIIDADEAKKVLPEYQGGIGASAVHEESTDLMYDDGGPLQRLMGDGSNVVIQKIGHNPQSIRKLRDALAKKNYQVDLINLAVDPQEAFRRRTYRFLDTGRINGTGYHGSLAENGDAASRSYHILEAEGGFDDTLNVDANGPRGKPKPIIAGHGTALARDSGVEPVEQPGSRRGVGQAYGPDVQGVRGGAAPSVPGGIRGVAEGTRGGGPEALRGGLAKNAGAPFEVDAPTRDLLAREGIPYDLEQIPPADIKADPARFQYRALTGEGADVKSGHTGRKMREGWQQIAPMMVWRDNSGQDWILDGHHRLVLAKNLANTTNPDLRINGLVLREADMSAQEAKDFGQRRNEAREAWKAEQKAAKEAPKPAGKEPGPALIRRITRTLEIAKSGFFDRERAGVPNLLSHDVTTADGNRVNVRPRVVEDYFPITSDYRSYDLGLGAPSEAKVRGIADTMTPEMLGHSADADRGAPIIGPDGKVESGNARVLALRQMYHENGPQAEAYREWLRQQGVDVPGFQRPILVRQRETPLTKEQRQDFTAAANEPSPIFRATSPDDKTPVSYRPEERDAGRLLSTANELAGEWQRKLGPDIRVTMGGSLTSRSHVRSDRPPDMDVRFLTDNPERDYPKVEAATGLKLRKTIAMSDYPKGMSKGYLIEGPVTRNGVTFDVEAAVRTPAYAGWGPLYPRLFTPDELAAFRADKARLADNKPEYKALKARMLKEAERRADALGGIDQVRGTAGGPFLSAETKGYTGEGGPEMAERRHEVGFGQRQGAPDNLTVNDILHPDTPAVKGRNRTVNIAKHLMQRGSNALRALGVASGRIEAPDPHTDAILADAMASEAKAALGRDEKTGADWYTGKVREALAVAGTLHPEINTDPNARTAFTLALALTSQGEKVPSNARLTELAYDQFSKTGRFPENLAVKSPDINDNFKVANRLINAWGMDRFREFLHSQYTVRQLENNFKEYGLKIGDENKDTLVHGSAVFGPKVGGGFFQNLNGNYDPVTTDLWFMRTWGRLTGTLVGAKPEVLEAQRQRLIDALRAEGRPVPRTQAKMRAVADQIMAEHEKDFRENRALYDAKKRTKSELTKAADRYVFGYDGINETPTSGGHRNWIRDVVGNAQQSLADDGIHVTNADLQAILWYPEKNLYAKLGGTGVTLTNQDYSEAFQKIAKQKGKTDAEIAEAIRSLDRRSGQAERNAALEGWRADTAAAGTGRATEGVERASRPEAEESGRGRDTKPYAQLQSYEGTGRANDGGVVRQTYRPTWPDVEALRARGAATPVYQELNPDAGGTRIFHDAISKAKAANKYGAAVHVYSPDEYSGMRLFTTPDRKAGFAIKNDGDIVSGFKHPDLKAPKIALSLLDLATSQGGRQADAFDTGLPSMYAAGNLRAVARIHWDDKEAPPGWDYDTFKEHNGGRPDVVFMVHDPFHDGTYEAGQGQVARDYAHGKQLQQEALAAIDARLAAGEGTETAQRPRLTPQEKRDQQLAVQRARAAKVRELGEHGGQDDVATAVEPAAIQQTPKEALRPKVQKIIGDLLKTKPSDVAKWVASHGAMGVMWHLGMMWEPDISAQVDHIINTLSDRARISKTVAGNLINNFLKDNPKKLDDLRAEASRVPAGWEYAEGNALPVGRKIRLGPTIDGYVNPEYTAHEREIADAVTAIGQKMAPGANIQAVGALRQRGSPIWGAFVNNEAFPKLIAWSLEQGGGFEKTIRHEVVHYLRDTNLIKPEEWQALSKAAVDKNWLSKHDIDDRYPGLSRDHQIEEAVANEFGAWRANRTKLPPGLMRNAFLRMDLFMRRVAAATRKAFGRQATANDIFTRIETGEIGGRARRARGGRVENLEGPSDRSVFLYMEPHPSTPDFAQCKTCERFIPKTQRCYWFGRDDKVEATDTCGLYVQGPPMKGTPRPIAKVTPQEAGFFKGKVRCQNCNRARTPTKCGFFETLNREQPKLFKLDPNIKPLGCCNAFQEKPQEKPQKRARGGIIEPPPTWRGLPKYGPAPEYSEENVPYIGEGVVEGIPAEPPERDIDSRGRPLLGTLEDPWPIPNEMQEEAPETDEVPEDVRTKRASGGRVMSRPKIDTSHDVRWISEMARDGSTFYRDRSLPKQIINNKKWLKIDEPLKRHEVAEYKAIRQMTDEFKKKHGRGPDDKEREHIYEDAHYNHGELAEHDWLRSHGYDVRQWEAWCRGKLAHLEKKRDTKPVPDPHVRPYPHDRRKLESTI